MAKAREESFFGWRLKKSAVDRLTKEVKAGKPLKLKASDYHSTFDWLWHLVTTESPLPSSLEKAKDQIIKLKVENDELRLTCHLLRHNPSRGRPAGKNPLRKKRSGSGRPTIKTRDEMETHLRDWEISKAAEAGRVGKQWITDAEFIRIACARDRIVERAENEKALKRAVKYWRDQTGIRQKSGKSPKK